MVILEVKLLSQKVYEYWHRSGSISLKKLSMSNLLPFRVLNFEHERSRHGLLNVKYLMTNHVSFDTQLEYVLASRVHA